MLVALLVMAYTIRGNWEHDKKAAYAQNMAAASAVATRQKAITSSTETLLRTLEATGIIQTESPQKIEAVFAHLNKLHTFYIGLAVFNTKGVPLALASQFIGTLPISPEVIRQRPYFKRAIEQKGFHISEAFTHIEKNDMFFLPMTYSLLDATGQINSVMLAPLALAQYDDIIHDSLGISDRVVELYDRDMRLMYTSQANTSNRLGERLANPELLEAFANDMKELSLEAKDLQQNPHLYSIIKLSHPSSDTPYMYILVKNTRPSFVQFVRHNFWHEISILIASLVFGLLIARTLGRNFFTAGLERLAYVAEKIQQGDLSQRSGEVSGCSEIRLLSQTFDAMLDSMEKNTQLLEKERSKLEIALDSAALGTWEWSNKSPVTYFDKRLLKMLGFDPENPPQSNLFLLIHPDDRRFSKSSLRAHLMGKTEQYTCEVRLQHQQGHWLWVLLHGRMVKHDPQTNEFVLHGTSLDITQHKRLEQIEQEKSALYRQLSRTDELTGLWNRRYFLELAKSELRRASHVGSCIAVIMADLDHFKKINDTYGHQSGDVVLQAFANLLRSSTRESDIVARYGGEEFVFLLPDSSLEGACTVMEKIRASCEALEVVVNNTTICFTASFGVHTHLFQARSKVEQDPEFLHQLIEEADKALYAAKNSGRNKVMCSFSSTT